jgi:hypothetical protein
VQGCWAARTEGLFYTSEKQRLWPLVSQRWLFYATSPLWLRVQHRGSALNMGSHSTSIDEIFTSNSKHYLQSPHTLGPVGRTRLVLFIVVWNNTKLLSSVCLSH